MDKPRNRLWKSVAAAPVRTCMSLHLCAYCGYDITLGQHYRDKGYSRRVHEEPCYRLLAKEMGHDV